MSAASEWQALFDAGHTATSAARVRDVTPTAAYQWAKRNGKTWPPYEMDHRDNFMTLAECRAIAAKEMGLTPTPMTKAQRYWRGQL